MSWLKAKRLRWLVFIGIFAATVAWVAAPSLLADDLSDAIDEARIKARAGKNEDAIADLDKLIESNPDDPRLHYYRCKILQDLDRKNDAADSLEKAVAAMDKYKRDGGNDAAILGVAANIDTEAKEVLKYRREARTILQDYRTKSLVIAEKLLKEGKPVQAAYVLDELTAAVGKDSEITDMRKRVDEAITAKSKDEKKGK